MFYGPPGTGKTTTIINLINLYQKTIEKEDNSLMIHLNASDDRGIDIIRNHILQFVNSKCLFTKGLKFIILDEVDYMTKNAQQALRYLIHMNSNHVRFCLICNYISRIDSGLKTELVKIRFNNLPQENIQTFLENITHQEQLNINTEEIKSIQSLYGSDIRSMINFIQCNQGEKGKKYEYYKQRYLGRFYCKNKKSFENKFTKTVWSIRQYNLSHYKPNKCL